MDTLMNAAEEPPSRERTVPFQIVMRAERWLHFPESDDPDEMNRREIGREAFSNDNDTLRFEIRPTESGVVVESVAGRRLCSAAGVGAGPRLRRAAVVGRPRRVPAN